MKRLLTAVGCFALISSTAVAGAMWRVTEIVDGNTLVVEQDQKKMTVGLIAVVTPDPKDTKYGLQSYANGAKQFLTAFVKNQWLYLEKDSTYKAPKQNSPQQVYAWRTDGAFVNERVIAEGFGVAYTKNAFQYRSSFGKQQKAAIAAKRGLWGDEDPTVAIRRGTSAQSKQGAYLGEGPSWDTPKYGTGSVTRSGTGSATRYGSSGSSTMSPQHQSSERVNVWLVAVFE